MKASLFHGRVGVTLALHAMGMFLLWGLAGVAVVPVLHVLARHPDGSFALLGEGGRILADVFRQQSSGVWVGLAGLAFALLLWSASWCLLGGTLPVLGVVEPAPSLHRAASYSLRCAPTLLGLALLTGTGYALAGAACWLGSGPFLVAIARDEAPFVVGLHELVGVAVAVVIGAFVSVWHDVARVVAVGRGVGAASAAGGALMWIVRDPLGTLGAAAMHTVAGGAGVALAYGASWVWGGNPARVAVAVLTVTQQAALAWRFAWRARWFYHLGARFRARSGGRSGALGEPSEVSSPTTA